MARSLLSSSRMAARAAPTRAEGGREIDSSQASPLGALLKQAVGGS